jgi:hypothetical protein
LNAISPTLNAQIHAKRWRTRCLELRARAVAAHARTLAGAGYGFPVFSFSTTAKQGPAAMQVWERARAPQRVDKRDPTVHARLLQMWREGSTERAACS